MVGFVMGQRIASKAVSMSTGTGLADVGLDRQIAELEQRMERLTLLTGVMWEVLVADGHSEQELIDLVDEARRRAEQQASTVERCIGCGARLLPTDPSCQTCGRSASPTTIHPLDPGGIGPGGWGA
jgi:hypothetical protein